MSYLNCYRNGFVRLLQSNVGAIPKSRDCNTDILRQDLQVKYKKINPDYIQICTYPSVGISEQVVPNIIAYNKLEWVTSGNIVV